MAKFFGTTRFSVYVPGSNAWVVSSRMSETEYLEHLYSDERLEPRFQIFFGVAAPIYQTFFEKYAYRHILQYSDMMPEKWKAALFEQCARFPVFHLKETSNKTGAADAILQLMTGLESDTIALIRVDDDDVLSADYLDQLSAFMTPAYRSMAVSFGLGVAAIYRDGEFREFREVKEPLLSQGQAYIGSYNAETGKLHLPRAQSHSQIDRFTPTILDSRKHAFLWVHHENQDTRVTSETKKSDDAMVARLAKMPVIPDDGTIGKLFPSLSG